MKKLYFSMAAMGLALGASGQGAALLTVKNQMPTAIVAVGQPVAPPSVAGGTPALWSDDFSTPGNWVVGNTTSNSNDWVIGTAVPAGDFPIDAIASTSAANGYALYDSDLYCGTDDAFVRTVNPIDLSASNAVVLTFEQHYRNYQGASFVEVSADGNNWTSFEVNGALAVNASTTNPHLAQVNISSVAGGQSQVWIGFRYVGACDYSWMVDDVAIVAGSDNDLELLDVWHGDIVAAFEYLQIPLAQAHEVSIGAACVNQGGASQTAVSYAYTITRAGTEVATGSFDATNATIPSAGSDTTFYATGYTPDAVGTYVVTITVSSAEGDENAENNVGTSSFMITDFIFAHDDEENIAYQIYGGEDDNQQPNEFKAALYYEAFADATLTGVQVAFGANTTTDACYVEVFDVVADQNLANPLLTMVFDITPAMISGTDIIPVNIPLDGGNGVVLTAGGTYLISVGNTGPGEALWILASDGDDDRAGIRFGPFGAGGAIDWYTGYTTSPWIRGNFDPAIGISENEDLTGIQMFPNPATDVLTVKFNANEANDIRISVVSMDGKLVYTQNAKAFSGQFTSRISLDGLSTGLYSVQVMSSNATYTEKVAVVK
ncbi:MAG: T9SS type A sorting domain-containing protein [Flavobacteriales bacterium]|nr:T9SS type A sorting domain-containing protein [Flavobacteriales bacterium]